LTTAILIVGSYLLGSIPFGILVGRAFGFDPRTVGSGNIGMANVARAGGGRAAALTFAGDALKGFLPAMVARASGFDPGVVALAALAAFVGSIASVFLKFRGGKGVACAMGVWLALAPAAVAIALAAFGLVVWKWRIMSLASLSFAIAMPPAVAVLSAPSPYIGLAIVISALVLLRHHENIGRLIRGEEPTFRASPGRTSA
jgi:acyl phosphate:glycerol-3-phosphate acyltransferase